MRKRSGDASLDLRLRIISALLGFGRDLSVALRKRLVDSALDLGLRLRRGTTQVVAAEVTLVVLIILAVALLSWRHRIGVVDLGKLIGRI